MAFDQDKRPGYRGGLTAWLVVPRNFTLPVLLLVGASLGQLFFNFLSFKLLVWLSGLSAPFCIVCATAVWAMRDKSDLGFLSDTLNSEEHKKAQNLEISLHKRTTKLAALSVLSAFGAAGPTIASELVGTIWPWMVVASGCGVAFSVYAYLLANHWEYQIRAQKSRTTYEYMRSRERLELIAAGSRGTPATTDVDLQRGWIEVPDAGNWTSTH